MRRTGSGVARARVIRSLDLESRRKGLPRRGVQRRHGMARSSWRASARVASPGSSATLAVCPRGVVGSFVSIKDITLNTWPAGLLYRGRWLCGRRATPEHPRRIEGWRVERPERGPMATRNRRRTLAIEAGVMRWRGHPRRLRAASGTSRHAVACRSRRCGVELGALAGTWNRLPCMTRVSRPGTGSELVWKHRQAKSSRAPGIMRRHRREGQRWPRCAPGARAGGDRGAHRRVVGEDERSLRCGAVLGYVAVDVPIDKFLLGIRLHEQGAPRHLRWEGLQDRYRTAMKSAAPATTECALQTRESPAGPRYGAAVRAGARACCRAQGRVLARLRRPFDAAAQGNYRAAGRVRRWAPRGSRSTPGVKSPRTARGWGATIN